MRRLPANRTPLMGMLAVLVLGLPTTALAGPWIKAPGEGYVKAGATVFSAEDSFNQGQSLGLAYLGQTYNLYGEFGLPGGLQVVADVPMVVATNTSAAGVNYINRTLGDMRLELDYGVLQGGPVPLAVGVEAKLPLYTPISEQGVGDPAGAFPRSAAFFPDPGDGNVDVTVKALTGYSFYPAPAWATAELGYRARLGGFADGLHLALSAGGFVWPEHLALGFYASAVVNLQDDPNPELRSTRAFTYLQGFAIVTAAPLDPDLSLTVGVGSIVQAENSSRGTDVSLGVSYAF